jgi:very-short-patch-repair endonuclease
MPNRQQRMRQARTNENDYELLKIVNIEIDGPYHRYKLKKSFDRKRDKALLDEVDKLMIVRWNIYDERYKIPSLSTEYIQSKLLTVIEDVTATL